MGSLQPRMDLAGCHFAHREPCLDCSDLVQIWHVDEEELPAEAIARSLDAVPDRASFIGHFHRWHALTRGGPLAWDGSTPLALPAGPPSLVIVAAVCDGHAAILDTEARILTPVDLYENQPRPDHRPIPRLVLD